jgi:hypothetical protein
VLIDGRAGWRGCRRSLSHAWHPNVAADEPLARPCRGGAGRWYDRYNVDTIARECGLFAGP